MDAANHPFDPYTARLIQLKAREICRRAGLHSSYREDIEQDLRQLIWQQAGKFDPRRAKWSTFVQVLVDRRGVSIRRYVQAQRRSPCRLAYSLDSPPTKVPDATHRDSFPSALEHDPTSEVDLTLDIQHVLDGLPQDVQLLARAIADGTRAEVVRAQGWSRPTLDRHMAMLIRALEDAGLRAYL